MDYNIKRMEVTDDAIFEVMLLLHIAFPDKAEKFSFEYLKWQYLENPRGKVVAFNAYTQDGQIAAHYATIPVVMLIDNREVPGLLSLNTATHPDHRGKRLFTVLAQHTYDYGKELGRKFVIGVANANSTHGFLKYLDFYSIAPLEVKCGVGSPYKDETLEGKHHIHYDEPALQWRLKCPYYSYSIKGSTLYGRLNKPLFHTAIARMPEGFEAQQYGLKNAKMGFTLFVGLGCKLKSSFFTLPKFIKRSPFNLIFKDMSDGTLPRMTSNNIVFQLIDFDVA